MNDREAAANDQKFRKRNANLKVGERCKTRRKKDVQLLKRQEKWNRPTKNETSKNMFVKIFVS